MGENQTKSEDFEKKEGVLTIGGEAKGGPYHQPVHAVKSIKLRICPFFPQC